MDATSATAEAVKDELLSHCASVGSVAIEGTPVNVSKGPTIQLGFEEFLSAVTAETPKALFWCESIFEIDAWIEEELESAGWDEEKVGDEDGYWPSLAQARLALAPRLEGVQEFVGRAYFLMAVYTTDAVPRVMSFCPVWYDELSTAVEDLLEERMEAVRMAHSRVDVANASLIKDLINEIASREDFRATKGLPKRGLLIQALYGAKIPKHPKGLMTRIKPHLDLMDVNMAYVLKEADAKTWIDDATRAKPAGDQAR